jgi:putative tryptophan/tyrosine transport system substrate-binding protein
VATLHIARFREDDIGGFILVADPFFVNRRDQIISSASQGRFPGVYFLREFAESGGLASYGSNLAEAYRQAGVYAGKILSGSKPNDLPVVQPTNDCTRRRYCGGTGRYKRASSDANRFA